jgi:hypothetical protein
MTIKGELSGRINGREWVKGEILGMKRIQVCYIYTYEDSIMKLTKHCLKRRENVGLLGL